MHPNIKERLERASQISLEDKEAAGVVREEVKARMAELLGRDGVVMLPTAPCAAPLVGGDQGERGKMISLTCAAGLAGLP